MTHLTRCPNCGSESFRTWSASFVPEALHFSQCRCQVCNLVFSNPQANDSTIRDYYSNSYHESHWSQYLQTDEETTRQVVTSQTDEVHRVMKFTAKGRMLEVGCGTGGFLAAARNAGFETVGVEISRSAVEHCRKVHGLENVTCGALSDTRFESASFDVVYTWHVIQQVLDLDEFISELHRVLRPGGLLWVGTENYHNVEHYAIKGSHLLRGCPPPFATSNEHTFAFTQRTLSDVLQRRGFKIIEREAYQQTLREKMETMRFRSPLSRSYFMAQHGANLLARTGPLLRLAARRK